LSNFNRKLKKNKQNSSSVGADMVKTFEMFQIPLDFTDEEKIFIESSSYNKHFFQSSEDLFDGYGLFFNDYVEFCEKNQEIVRVIVFLEDSVKNNHYLCDSLTELDFTIKDNHIFFKNNGQKNDYINIGEFYIDNYKVNVCHSYMFFEDILTNKKFMYYGD